MPKPFKWDETTRYEDIPSTLRKLIPASTNLDALDEVNQIDHVRYRVQHENDIAEEEGLDEVGMSPQELTRARRFLILTAPQP